MRVDDVGVPEGVLHDALAATYIKTPMRERILLDKQVDILRARCQKLSIHGALEILAAVGRHIKADGSGSTA